MELTPFGLTPVQRRFAFGLSQEERNRNIWGGILRDPAVEAAHRSIRAARENIWGVWLEDRLVAVYLDRGYGHLWQEGITGYNSWYNRPVCHLGVNLLVYALTRTESTARQYVDWSAEGKINQAAQKEQ